MAQDVVYAIRLMDSLGLDERSYFYKSHFAGDLLTVDHIENATVFVEREFAENMAMLITRLYPMNDAIIDPVNPILIKA